MTSSRLLRMTQEGPRLPDSRDVPTLKADEAWLEIRAPLPAWTRVRTASPD